MEKAQTSGGASYFFAVLTGLATALAVLAVLSLTAAAVVYFSPLNEEMLKPAALFIEGVMMLSGGFMAAKSSGRRGLIMGAVIGLVMLVLVLLIGPPQGNLLGQILVCLLCALTGGVLGVR